MLDKIARQGIPKADKGRALVLNKESRGLRQLPDSNFLLSILMFISFANLTTRSASPKRRT